MDSIIKEIKGPIAIIRLNRPEKLNAFNGPMAILLQQILDACTADSEIRVIMLTGNGKAFSAGQDLAELTGENPPDFKTILSKHYNPIVQRIRQIEKPVIAAINGVAAGAGANIALCCDIVLAAASATIIQAFSKIGLIPDSGGTYMLPRLAGWQKASALMLLSDKLTADEAERIGLLYKVFPDDHFMQSCLELASTLAAMPPGGLALTKQALNASCNNTFDQQLQTEDRLQFDAAQTYDYNEAVKAFTEKRKPVFLGR